MCVWRLATQKCEDDNFSFASHISDELHCWTSPNTDKRQPILKILLLLLLFACFLLKKSCQTESQKNSLDIRVFFFFFHRSFSLPAICTACKCTIHTNNARKGKLKNYMAFNKWACLDIFRWKGIRLANVVYTKRQMLDTCAKT